MCVSGARSGAQKGPEIASISFHFWQRIMIYQQVIDDFRDKFFSRPSSRQAATRRAPTGRFQAAPGGTASMNQTLDLLLQDGDYRTNTEHAPPCQEIVSLFCRRENRPRFPLQPRGDELAPGASKPVRAPNSKNLCPSL
jgi:hypothetical protein